MRSKIGLMMTLAVFSACAAQRNVHGAGVLLSEKAPGLFVGHSETGEVVVAATHYDAMNGVAVLDTDLGLEARKDGVGAMMCRRELPTGTHVPHWLCRYVEDAAHERQLTLNILQQPSLSPSTSASGGMAGSLGPGVAPRAQTR